MRFWDAERELHAFDLATGTDAAVTCIDSSFAGVAHENYMAGVDLDKDDEGISIDDEDDGKSCRSGMVVVGCQDGSIRVFDRRCSPSEARVALFMDHLGPVLGVYLMGNTFYSGR